MDMWHWNLFISLEDDFRKTINYVALDKNNFNTYSVEYLKLILINCQAFENAAKALCLKLNPNINEESIKTMWGIRSVLNEHIDKISKIKCTIEKFDHVFYPLYSWKRAKNNILPWWKSYNNIKHQNSYQNSARLKNVLYSLAGLFCINLYLYKTELYNAELWPLPQLFYYESMPAIAAYNEGAELPGFPRT